MRRECQTKTVDGKDKHNQDKGRDYILDRLTARHRVHTHAIYSHVHTYGQLRVSRQPKHVQEQCFSAFAWVFPYHANAERDL